MSRQYVACRFGSSKAYTYHNDGEPIAVGDKVVVESRGGEATVLVVEVWPAGREPGFPTKPVLRKAPAGEPAVSPDLI